ncbi:DUF5801 repeats-in-toxin domain-containing protein [Roseibium sp.]|uniref:DUF5801 repeats-in-toxin domain-containing protein n=3 Tax=unclassified Roseibium TaxID=2629323 RepID=UPI003BA996E2
MSVEDLKSALDNTSDDLVDTAAQSESQLDDASSEAGDSEAVVVAQAGDDATPVDAADSESATEAASDGASPIIVTANDQNQVLLPAGTSLDDVVISGAELILLQPDGTEIIIRNGALNVPTFIIDNIEIPQEALVAAFANSGIDIAAGPDGTLIATAIPEGAGADFVIPPGGIGDAGPLIDLLGRTELAFPILEDRELFADEREGDDDSGNNLVTVVATSILSPDEVAREAGINQTSSQSPGSDEIADGDGFNDSSDLEVSAIGLITVTAPDGIAEVRINGVVVDLENPGTVIDGTYGFITISSVNADTGEFEYFYTATSNLDHPLDQDILTETFTVEATDSNGDSSTTTFQVGIFDDVPSVVAEAEADVSAILDEGDQDQDSPSTGVMSDIDTGAIEKGDDPDVPNTGGAAIASAVTIAPFVNITPIFGADGEADFDATQFAFKFSSNESGVTLTDGSKIVLVDVNGDGSVIVGEVTEGTFAEKAAFALQIDPGTGLVTVEQYLSLSHPLQHDGSGTGQSYDESVDLADSSLEVVVTITDGDGDQAQASAKVGAQILFEDDGPVAEAKDGATAETAVLDESDGSGSGSDGALEATISAAQIAGLFEAPAYGADGAGSVSYALSVPVVATGLYLTGSTTEIELVKVDDQTFEGREGGAGGTLAFTVSINNDDTSSEFGEVTVTLESGVSLTHPVGGDLAAGGTHPGSDHDDSVDLEGLVFVVQTVTDGDNDTSSATSDNALSIEFQDDGPVAEAKDGATADTAVLDESDGSGSGSDGALEATISAAQIAGLFEAPAYGADGAGSVSYALSVPVVATGLYLTGSTTEIELVKVDDQTFEGREGGAGGTLAFTVSINNDDTSSEFGEVTVTLESGVSLTHPVGGDLAAGGTHPGSDHDDSVDLEGLVFVVQTVTDGDNDTSSATSANALSIEFQDDGPVAEAKDGATADTAVLDESDGSGSGSDGALEATISAAQIAGLFEAPAYGADGAGSVSYALSVPVVATGLYLTGSATEIELVKVDDQTFEGREGGAGGTLAFTVSINNDDTSSEFGEVTVTLESGVSLTHPVGGDLAAGGTHPGSDHDDSVDLEGLVFVVQTVTDGDNDTSSATSDNALSIEFQDDGPVAEAKDGATADTAVLDESDGSGSGSDGALEATISAAQIAGLFEAPAYGADGAGSVSYALSVPVVATGLYLTGSTTEIELVKVDDQTFEGREGGAGGTLAFTVSINNDDTSSEFGEVTVTLESGVSLTHPVGGDLAAGGTHPGSDHDDSVDLEGLVFVVQTVTDGDNDTSSATSDNALSIEFQDDGPVAEAKDGATADTAVLDESDGSGSGSDGALEATISAAQIAGLFEAPAYGADGAGSVSYALSVPVVATGLYLTGSTTEIELVKVDDQTFEGREGGAGGTLAFTVSINNDDTSSEFGEVTVTLESGVSLTHPVGGDLAAGGTHPGSDHDDSVDLEGLVFVVQTVTDGDNDTSSATSANALSIEFQDDGPVAEAKDGATADTAVLDESDGSGSGSDGALEATISAAQIAGLFEAPAYGADGAGSVSYALSVPVVATGLYLTGSATEIELVKVDDQTFEGREGGAGGTLAFTVSINNDDTSSEFGEVTVTLESGVSLTHPVGGDLAAGGTHPGSDHDDSVDLEGLVFVVQTVTDGDNDTSSATSANALSIEFQDDGPVAEAKDGATADTAVLDESDGTGSGSDGALEATISAAQIAGLFEAPAYGADGAGSVSYALSVPVVATGLYLTGSTTEIELVKVDDQTFEGREGGAGGTLAFTVSINNDDTSSEFGEVTVTLESGVSLTHPVGGDLAAGGTHPGSDHDDSVDLEGLVFVVQTVTDGDNDTSSATSDNALSIEFQDDGPVAEAKDGATADTAVLDESDGSGSGSDGALEATISAAQIAGLFEAPAYGADGAGSVSYALSVPVVATGLYLTGSTTEIELVKVDDQTFEGREGGAGGTLAFTVSINNDDTSSEFGEVTVTLESGVSLTHPVGGDLAAGGTHPGSDHDDSVDLEGLVFVVQTVTDGDNDTSSATSDNALSIEFQDDGPVAEAKDGATADTAVLDESDGSGSGSDGALEATISAAQIAGLFEAPAYGADGAGSVSYALSVPVVATGLYLTGSATEIELVKVDDQTFEGREGGAGGTLAFTVSINNDDTSSEFGEVTVTLESGVSLTHPVGGDLAAGGTHPGSDHDDSVDLEGLVFVVQTVTDGDNDTSSATSDNALSIEFQDDGPVAEAKDGATAETAVLDESDGSGSGSDGALEATISAAQIAGLFEAPAYGADGAGSVSYALSVPVVATGLYLTGSTTEIELVKVDDQTFEGREGGAGGTLAFTVSINNDDTSSEFGEVTVTLESGVSLTHPVGGDLAAGGTHPGSDHDDSVDLEGLVFVVQTVTDGDNDTSSATSDNALSIEFQDDGPVAEAKDGATADTAVLDESDGSGSGSDGALEATISAAQIAGLFEAPAYGADGAGSVSYALSVPVVATGLYLTGSATEIELVKVDDQTFEGREGGAGGTLAFTVSINNDDTSSEFGEVTVTLESGVSLTHPVGGDLAAGGTHPGSDHDDSVDLEGLVFVVQTVTDGDNDTSSATSDNALSIEFQDDGPVAEAKDGATADTAVLDESDGSGSGSDGALEATISAAQIAGLFEAPAYGADGAGSVSYALSVPVVATGLYLTGSTTEIELVKVDDQTFEGREGGAGGTLAFTVSINNDDTSSEFGEVTVTLESGVSLTHPVGGDLAAGGTHPGSDHDDSVDLEGLVFVVQTVTDGDNDTSSATSANALSIEFQDDGPVAEAKDGATADTAVLDESDGSGSGSDGALEATISAAQIAGLFEAPAYGADGAGSVSYALSVPVVATGLYLTGSATEIELVKVDDQTFEGREGGAGGTLAFTVSINNDDTSSEFGEVTVTLESGVSLTHPVGGDLAAGGTHPGSDHDDSVDLEGLVFVVQTVTDGDNDTSSATSDNALSIEFQDDGPVAEAKDGATADTAVLDESDGSGSGSDGALEATISAAQIAGLFEAPAYGADGAGSVSYALSVPVVATGLYLTGSTTEIELVKVDDQTFEGREGGAGGTLAFTVSINNDDTSSEFGEVTVTLESGVSLTHPVGGDLAAGGTHPGSDHDDSVDLEGLVFVVQTVTDGDNDTSSATSANALSIEFQDDGPVAEAKDGATADTAVLDESDGTGSGSDGALEATISAAQIAGLFEAPAYGADGAGSVSYALSVPVVATGLYLTGSTTEIELVKVDDQTFEGREGGAGGTLAFTVSINNDDTSSEFGEVTVTLESGVSLTHPVGGDLAAGGTHPGSDHDDSVDLEGLVFVVQTVTDGDNDTSSATSDNALSIEFQDDGPVAEAKDGATAETAVLDESDGSGSGSDGALEATISAAQIAGLFEAPAYGADGAGSVSYALSVPVVATGLYLTGSTTEIELVKVDDQTFEGREGGAGGTLAFTVSINNDDTSSEFGEVTVTLESGVSLTHPVGGDLAAGGTHPGSDHDDSVDLEGLVFVVQTVTDGDNDTSSATSDNALSIEFQDDGPVAEAKDGATAETAVLDESDGSGSGSDGALEATISAAQIAGLFEAPAYGADGAGSVSYALSVPVVATGLYLTGSTTEIELVKVDDQTFEGREGGAGGTLAFTVSINNDDTSSEFGEVTVTLESGVSLTHPVGGDLAAGGTHPGSDHDDSVDLEGLVFVVQTVTDGDNDTSSATSDNALSIEFQDDGPVAEAKDGATADTAVLDESDGSGSGSDGALEATISAAQIAGLFEAPAYGADGAGSVSYALSVPVVATGLYLTGSTTEIELVKVDDQTFEGREGGAGGTLAFTVSINNDDTSSEFGEVTVTLESGVSLTHPVGGDLAAGGTHPGSDHDDSVDLEGLVFVVQTVTDGDNDTSSATSANALSIEFQDDGPVAEAKDGATADTAVLDESDGSGSGSDGALEATISAAQIAGLFEAPAYGADGAGSVSYALSVPVVATGLYLTGSATEIELVKVDDQTFEGREGGAGGTLAFTVSINNDDTSSEFGEVTVTLESGVSLTHPVGGDLAAGGTHPGSDHDDSVDLEGLVFVVQTVTDGDNDTSSATSDNALSIEFQDDGPVAEAKDGATADTAVLDESDGSGSGSDGALEATISAAQIAGLFEAPAYGADGAGSVSYALSVPVVATGLYLTGSTTEIELVKVDDQTFEGREGGAGGTLAFTVSINNDDTSSEFGEVTVTLESGVSLTHPVGGDLAAGGTHPGSDHDDSVDLEGLVFVVQTVTDGDNDTSSATSANALSIEFQDDGPVVTEVSITSDTATLDESVGTDGSQRDEDGDAIPNDESLAPALFLGRDYGQIIGYATLAAALTYSFSAGADGLSSELVSLTDSGGNTHNETETNLSLSSTGQSIFLFTDQGIVVGRAGDNAGDAANGPVAFAIGIDGSDVVIAQYAALSHSDIGSHDEPVGLGDFVYVTVTVTDGDGDTAALTSNEALSISFEDDGPDAIDDSAQLALGQTDFNVLFVLDFSGSVDSNELATMLDAVEAAGQAFFNGAGDVQIQLVAFGANAASAGPFTDFTSFVNQLDAWESNRPVDTFATDYTDAINEAISIFNATQTPANADYNNQVFFLSDGNPNQNTRPGHSLQLSTQTNWNNLVTDNDVTVQTIGIGNNLDPSNLQDVDEVDGDNTVITVNTFDQLIQTLLDLVSAEMVSGNVLLGDDGVVGGGDDDSFGEDGGRILSIQVGTVLYTYDATADEITNNGGDPTEQGSELTVTTPASGTLEFNFVTGAWTYSATGSTSTGVEAFEYTLVDNDGDTSSATLSVDVVPAPKAAGDFVLTNITDFSPIDIPNDALLNNDTDGSGNGLNVTSVSDPTGGTVSAGVQFDPAPQEITRLYDFAGVTRGTNDHFAYEFEFDPDGSQYNGLFELTEAVGIGGPGAPSASEATNDDYEDIAEDGNGDWDVPDPGNDDHAVFWAQFSIGEAAASISEIEVTIDANSTDNRSDLGIWNYTTSQWVQLDGFSNSGFWSGSITSNFNDYLNASNQLTVAFVNWDDDDAFGVDYISVEVSADEAAFSSGSFDYEITDGNGFTDTANVSVTGVDSTTVTGTDEDEILIGNDNGSTLDGAGGNDYIVGGDSADTLIGGDGEDVLAGGLGVDLLWGGSLNGGGDGDIDTFVIDDATAVDIIGDFEAGVDEIDLTALINGLSSGEDPEAAGYVQVVQNGSNADVQVDTDGGGNGYQTVVTLQNFNVTDETVRILYNDADGDKGTNV